MLTILRTCLSLAFALVFLPVGLGQLALPGQRPALRYTCGFSISLVLFEILMLLFHAAGASFRLMVALWCLLCGIGAVLGLRRAHRQGGCRAHRSPVRPDLWELLLAVVVVLAIGVLTLNTVLNTTYKNWDDQTYCANAVATWQTDAINRYTFYSGKWVQPFYLVKYIVAGWPNYSSMLAVLSGVHPAIIFRTILPLFEIPAAFAVAWLLLRHFFPHSRKKALLGLLYYFLFVILVSDKTTGVSSEWWLVVNCWTGKALSFNLVTPAVLWLLFELESQAEALQRRPYWIALFFVSAASCTIAATMFMILPIELGLWGIFYLWRTRRWGEIRNFCLCAAPAVVCALATL